MSARDELKFAHLHTAAWFSNVVRAQCNECRWEGMYVDVNEPGGRSRAVLEAHLHEREHHGREV